MMRTRIVYARWMDSAIIRPFFSKQEYKNTIWLSTDHKVSQTSPEYSNELPCGLCVHLFIVLEFNDTSTLVGHFVSSPREREKRERRDSRVDQREEQGRKRNRNESKETEEIKTFPSILTCYKDSRPCPTVSQYQLDACVHFNLLSKINAFSNPWHGSEYLLRWGRAYPLGTQTVWMNASYHKEQ